MIWKNGGSALWWITRNLCTGFTASEKLWCLPCDGFCKINRKQKESIYESISLRFFKYWLRLLRQSFCPARWNAFGGWPADFQRRKRAEPGDCFCKIWSGNVACRRCWGGGFCSAAGNAERCWCSHGSCSEKRRIIGTHDHSEYTGRWKLYYPLRRCKSGHY